MTTLAERLQKAMDLRGFNQIDLEQAARLGKGYASRILSGSRRYLRPEQIAKIANALRVSHEWLAMGNGPMLAEGAPDRPLPIYRYDPLVYLTPEEMGHARARLRSELEGESATQESLGARYGVSQGIISRIVKRDSSYFLPRATARKMAHAAGIPESELTGVQAPLLEDGPAPSGRERAERAAIALGCAPADVRRWSTRAAATLGPDENADPIAVWLPLILAQRALEIR